MRHSEFLDKCYEHKHTLIFAAGIATAIVGKRILESKAVKNAATQGMATVMVAKRDVEETFQDMREDAEEIVIDAHETDKKEIYVESKE